MKNIDFPTTTGSHITQADRVQINLPSTPLRYYRHGWQSWSLAAWTDLTTLPVSKPEILLPLQVDAQYAWDKDPNGSWLGAVEFEDGRILLLGALGLGGHVTLYENGLVGQSEAGEIEWFVGNGQEDTVFGDYASQLGIRFGSSKDKQPPRIWCSWYSLFYMIDEQALLRIFDGIADLPFDVLQVDDGWQIKVGDWEANARFPSGMKALADKIKATGRKAGLWLAPFIAVESAGLFREHPDWFLRDEHGQLISAGFNWGEQLYALDTTHPGATEWLVALMKKVRAWGFDYLKLDFIYAGALSGRRFTDTLRETAFREALRRMRDAMGTETFLLTCGTPILPALGLCDAMRVGPDVASEWENYRDAYLFTNLTTPGTKNAIRTVLHRLWLNPLLHLDPDVVYLTQEWNTLTEEQRTLLRDLSLITGFKATSDLPQWMTPQEWEELRKYLIARPVVQQLDRYIFQIDERTVDFTSAISLPEPPAGWTAVWASILGWLANKPLILKINKRLNEGKFRQRRASLS